MFEAGVVLGLDFDRSAHSEFAAQALAISTTTPAHPHRQAALHDLLAAWLPRLVPGGEAWLGVQRHLGADSLARWISEQTDDAGVPWGEIEKVRSATGFRVLRLVRG